MVRCVDGLLLYEGEISRVSFSATKERAFVEFKEDRMVFEFRNGKRNRADHVKKLKLEVGERVIVIGAKSDSSPLYSFGYDIQRVGKVKNMMYSILRGDVQKIVRMKKSGFVYLTEDDKNVVVKTNPDVLKNIKEGMCVSLLCYQDTHSECPKTCGEWNLLKCSLCKLKNSQKVYTALECI